MLAQSTTQTTKVLRVNSIVDIPSTIECFALNNDKSILAVGRFIFLSSFDSKLNSSNTTFFTSEYAMYFPHGEILAQVIFSSPYVKFKVKSY